MSRVQPWKLANDQAHRVAFDQTLAALITLLARHAVLLSPVIPAAAERLRRSLGGPGSASDQRLDRLEDLDVAGWRVKRDGPLFPAPVSGLAPLPGRSTET